MSDAIECVVIGAGVIGLAVARALAMQGREVIIIEKENAIGTGISSRNSEVIHAGLYYTPGSLKARLCLSGQAMLKAFCDDHHVPYAVCGKLLVACQQGQIEGVEKIKRNAQACGVKDLVWLSAKEALELEPELACVAAVFSPSSGIVDSHALMLALLGDAQRHGAVLAIASAIESGRITDSGVSLCMQDGTRLNARLVVNCAGLFAPAVARSIAGLDPTLLPTERFAKGNYFTLIGKSPFQRLIYPIPEPGGLGVHLTLDLGGQTKFGPDVQWVDALDYVVDERRKESFIERISAYWPKVRHRELLPGYAGIRPKLRRDGQEVSDFVIFGPAEHGVAGLVHLFGIESPGLTACLALAEHVASMLD